MATKRPYSYDYTARANPRRYLLSGIPPTLWDRARARARREGVSMRTLILQLVEAWADRPEDAEVTLPDTRRRPTRADVVAATQQIIEHIRAGGTFGPGPDDTHAPTGGS